MRGRKNRKLKAESRNEMCDAGWLARSPASHLSRTPPPRRDAGFSLVLAVVLGLVILIVFEDPRSRTRTRTITKARKPACEIIMPWARSTPMNVPSVFRQFAAA